jgi:diaminopimelate epimerase
MNPLPFAKYSSNGNHFVLVDELEHALVAEDERAAFAVAACDPQSGIGADSVVFLLPPSPDADAGFASEALLVARFFDASGEEFCTCANALACVADYLACRRAAPEAVVLVEIPTGRPKPARIARVDGHCRVELRPDPATVGRFVRPEAGRQGADGLIQVDLPNRFPRNRPAPAFGTVLYTGEPHLVVFNGEPEDEEVREIGLHANRGAATRFPLGMNVNFARIRDDRRTIDYRCFERGLCRETLACGTGALAVAIAGRRLGLVEGEPLRLLPMLARRHRRYGDAEILVEACADGGWALSSRADFIFDGMLPA